MRISCLLLPNTLSSLLFKRASLQCLCRQTHRTCSQTASKPTTSTTETTGHVLYEPIEYVERMEYYRPGGYHPVKIGDRFHNRYRVVYQLGHGTFSTTWLARDEKLSRYVAVKVCTADSNPLEIDVLSKLSMPSGFDSQGSSVMGRGSMSMMIPPVWDTFHIHGPNGNHVCLVTSPARMSLSDAKNGSWISLFQLEVARAIVAQVVIAVHYLHARGFVHGDLHCGNILFRLCPGIDQLSTEELYEVYEEPELEPVNRLDGQGPPPGVPEHGVIPVWFGEASEKIALPEARIVLSDFGETFSPAQENRFESYTPLLIRPPEARFEPTKPLTFSSDIWSLGCTIWHIMAQKTLFEGFLTDEDDMACQQIDLLGQLPTEWWKGWEARRDKFTEDGAPINPAQFQSRSWEERFERNVQQAREREGMPSVEVDEREAFLAMLRSMLCYRPENRPSARQILESEWMVKWALPEYGRVCSGG